ncbi:MAG: Hsp20/alpha crystallin family protein [Actinobacteria bacterium]|jgi:HSP20 family protein|nr:MAG: Hsp20/alpha crystallin family protein [Actinomycetota bacterium]
MATLIRWDPFREMASLQNDMSRLINGAFGASNGESRSWIPPLDAWENEDELVYAFDLPGMDERDLSIEFEDGSLTVSGTRERKDEASKDGLYRYERRFGSFTRTIGLPQGVTEDSIKAEYKSGVLEVHVQKPEQPKPRRIEIGSGGHATIEGKSSRK